MTLCPNCIANRKVKGLETYTCVLCALGLSSNSDNVVKDPFTGTTHVYMTQSTYFDKIANIVTDSINKKGNYNVTRPK